MKNKMGIKYILHIMINEEVSSTSVVRQRKHCQQSKGQ